MWSISQTPFQALLARGWVTDDWGLPYAGWVNSAEGLTATARQTRATDKERGERREGNGAQLEKKRQMEGKSVLR